MNIHYNPPTHSLWSSGGHHLLGKHLHLVPYHLNATLIRGIQLKHTHPHHLRAIQLSTYSQYGRSFTSARRPVEQCVRKLHQCMRDIQGIATWFHKVTSICLHQLLEYTSVERPPPHPDAPLQPHFWDGCMYACMQTKPPTMMKLLTLNASTYKQASHYRGGWHLAEKPHQIFNFAS